jgi:hypothetical protein
VLVTLLGKLSPDSSSAEFVTPPPPPRVACVPIYSDQVTRTKLLRELATLDDSIAAQQRIGESQPGFGPLPNRNWKFIFYFQIFVL